LISSEDFTGSDVGDQHRRNFSQKSRTEAERRR